MCNITMPEIRQTIDDALETKRQVEIHFTGFDTERKLQMTDLAEEKNCKVRKGVTRYLDFLICGPNAGSAKVPRAEDQGTLLICGECFVDFIECQPN